MMSGSSATFVPFSGNAYDSDYVRSAIDAIARNGAKLKARHIRRVDGRMVPPVDNLDRLLQVRPNPYMNAYAFYYKVITHRYLHNNAFVFIDRGPSGLVNGLYPVSCSSAEFLEVPSGEIFVRFTFTGGKQVILPYADIIHLRRFFNSQDLLGDQSQAFITKLALINTIDQGVANAIQTTANFKGLIKVNAMLKPSDLKKVKDDFVSDYMHIENSSGVAALDNRAEYQELKHDPKTVDDKQLNYFKQAIYDYFGVSAGIVESKYNEDEWNAFYEGTLEPMALEMSTEFTSKLFSGRSQGYGNEVIFEANRLQYASNKTKIQLIKEAGPLGILTVNEAREVFNLAPVEDGDKRLQTLNVINAAKADKYQMGEEDDDGQSDQETD
jgi:HK97 family phage portal protein